MFRRDNPVRLGDYMRRGLEPLAQRIGVDFDESFLNAPTTDEARAFDAYRCGQSLLMSFTYPDGWPTRDGTKRLARKAAKIVNDGLLTEQGAHAVSFMTQGFAHEMADFWRRGADSCDDAGETATLRESAARSDALGELAGRYWPVSDPFGALEQIALYERQRVVDVANPDAMIDLRSYFGRASVACGAAALALGDEAERYGGLLYMPVAFLDLDFATGLQADWVFQLNVWQNLLSDHPLAYANFIQSQ